MKKYSVVAYGDYERGLKRQEATITAKDSDDAYTKAWKMLCEYKEIFVTESD